MCDTYICLVICILTFRYIEAGRLFDRPVFLCDMIFNASQSSKVVDLRPSISILHEMLICILWKI